MSGMHLPLIILLSMFAYENCQDSQCCSVKKVGEFKYILKRKGDPLELSQFGCVSSCIYTLENEDSKEYCFSKGTMETECLADGHQSPVPLKVVSSCCQKRKVKGQEYMRVEHYNGEIPENCEDSCIYTKNTSTTFDEYFCFTKRNNLVPILKCETLDQIQSTFEESHPLDESAELKMDPIKGCPSYEDLQTDEATKGQCAYWWVGNDNSDMGQMFGFNGCGTDVYSTGHKTDMKSISKNHQWTAAKNPSKSCVTSHYMRICPLRQFIDDIIVAPGCNLYLYGQPDFIVWDETEINTHPHGNLKNNYINVIEGPNIIHEYRKYVQSMVCSCGSQSPGSQSQPKDSWEVILLCDNRKGIAPTTCDYVKKIGTTIGSRNSTGGSQSNSHGTKTSGSGSAKASYSATVGASAGAFGASVSASATLSAELEAKFSHSVTSSSTTGVDWSSVDSSSFEEAFSTTISETVPAGKCLRVEQAVGYAGQAVVKTNIFKMTSCG